ncbi:MAG: hypothetical protein IPK80_05420 [Nannocystis sp.]|nr:hypothetical protein [Nannocystis sp.]
MPRAPLQPPALKLAPALFSLALSACTTGAPPLDLQPDRPAPSTAPDPRPAALPPAAPPPALLPAQPGEFAPSLTRVAPTGPTGAQLADSDTCARCHPDAAAQWSASAHHFASFNNPIYRASVDRFRERLGAERSRFCAGCHDPALLVDGAIDHPIDPLDPRAHVGVTCRTCHGIDHATYDGNGSYRLADADLALPDPRDAASVARHRALVARPALRSGELCGSCHRAFLDESTGHPFHFAGTDDLAPWHASPHGGSRRRLDAPLESKRCIDCHMQREPAPLGDLAAKQGAIASHRFLGGHTWLAQIRRDPAALARTQRFLGDVVTLDVAALTHPDGRRDLPAETATLTPGERIVLDLVLRNRGVGHRFPGGTRDAQDTRLEVTITRADGRPLAHSAAPHRLRAAVVGEDGRPRDAREVEDLRVAAYDHTLGAREAAVIRVGFDLPADLPPAAFPLRVATQLIHRSRLPELAATTCEQARTPTGRAFLRATAALSGARLDPCAAPPPTTIATASIELGPGAAVTAQRPTWERLYELGLGLQGELQERLGLAKSALDAALPGAVASAPFDEALVLAALAEVAAAQGRVDEALQLADRVAALLPDHPAAASLRGLALAAVWRWERAAPHLARGAAQSPLDPRAWSTAAVAWGSAGATPELCARALQAAQAGLRLSPRDPDLLRVQALALRDLHASDAEAAFAAYLDHRPADGAPGLRARCSAEAPDCARERLPVHEHPLTPR